MPTMTIDGKACSFEGKPLILEVALDNGVEIPHYCWHPALSVVASCRICLAEVAQPNPRNDNKIELIPKLLPTCQTPAADGMEVFVSSPKAIANQKAVMEYLLINHPLDCPVCDQAGECHLQDYSFKYGRSASRFEETKIKQPKKDLGPYVLLYTDRCIMCTRCVRFTKEVSGTSEIGLFGRGSSEQIDIFPGRALDNELSGNVIDICPVGALLDKDFLMSMRVWNLEKTPGIDGMTASGDNISIESNGGRIYRFKPRMNMDVNQWWISDEIRFGWRFVHHADRLRSPSRKAPGGRESCVWPEAYNRVRTGFGSAVEQAGPGALAVMISPMLPCEEAYLLCRFALGIDEKAVIGIGPVPVVGKDKTFPGGYTTYAEKCPNSRGVRRTLDQLTDRVLPYEKFLSTVTEAGTTVMALLLTGNYREAWPDPDLVKAATGRFTVLIDTLPNELAERAEVLLPGATWVEKAGTFENANNRLQSFGQAIAVPELARTEGRIATDLMGATAYDTGRIRREMGGCFVTDVHPPPVESRKVSDMQVVAL